MSRRSVALTILVAALVFCPNCSYQPPINTPPGERTLVTGVVKDSDGSVLGNVTVKGVKAGSTFTVSISTDSNGNYILDNLETGNYKITASLDGYLPSTRETNLSSAGDQAKIDFELIKKPSP
jgi:hypothetical protein